MIIEILRYYTARIKYHRTDDLKPDTLPDGNDVHVQALWIDDEGEVIFSVAESYYNLPQKDLIDFKSSTREEYLKHRI